jgi:hypothetical protein
VLKSKIIETDLKKNIAEASSFGQFILHADKTRYSKRIIILSLQMLTKYGCKAIKT